MKHTKIDHESVHLNLYTMAARITAVSSEMLTNLDYEEMHIVAWNSSWEIYAWHCE